MLETMAALSIQLLGPFQLSIQGESVTAMPLSRLQFFLAYLLLHPAQALSRTQIAVALWPDLSDSRSKTRLRRLLHDIRRSLPELEAYLDITSSTVRWCSEQPSTVDVETFTTALEQAQTQSHTPTQIRLLQKAAALYRGPLLQGSEAEWLEAYRQQYQASYSQLLEDLIQLLSQENQFKAALPYAQRWVQLNPLQENSYFALMQLHLRLGQRDQALQVYQHCADQLLEALGLDPGSALQALRQTALTPNTSSPLGVPAAIATVPSSSTPTEAQTDWGAGPDVSLFQGREMELQQLEQWITESRCRLIALLGVGGVGKTALSVELAQRLLQPQKQSPSQVDEGFTHVIWRSLRNPLPLTQLLETWVSFLSNQQDTEGSPRRLLHWLRQSRCLLILDNVETILQGGSHAGYCRPEYEDYSDLFRLIGEAAHSSCLLLTSREKPAEVAAFEGIDFAVRSMPLDGVPEAANALIEAKQLQGSTAEKQQLGDRYSWNPLALKIVTTSIQELFDGDIGLFLAEGSTLSSGLRRLLDQQFGRLSEVEQTLMFWIAIHRDWTTIAELAQDMMPTVARSELLEGLESLRWRSLIEKSRQHQGKSGTQPGAYTQQPVILDYVTTRLVEQLCQELTDFQQSGQPLQAFNHFALLQTTVTDNVRMGQVRMILEPIWQHLTRLGSSEAGRQQLLEQLLQALRHSATTQAGYAAGNLLNLGCQVQYNWQGANFSGLTLRHAHLQAAQISRVNFEGARFEQASFIQTFASVLSVAYSPDGRYLATGDSNTDLQLWSAIEGQLLFTLQQHQDWVRTVAFSPDGSQLVSGCDAGQILLWEVETGTVLRSFEGHIGRVSSLKFSPDGEQLISSGEDRILRLWQVSTAQLIRQFEGHQQSIWSVAFHPNGHQFASSSEDQTIRLWDLATGRCQAKLEGHQNSVWSLIYSPEGNALVSGSYDGILKIWDLATQRCKQSLRGHTDWICSVVHHPHQPLIATSSNDETIRIWDATTGQCLRVLQGHHHRIWSLAFSPDGHTLASGGDDQTLRLWEVERWVQLKAIQGHSYQVIAIAISPDGQTLASGGDEEQIRLWSPQTGECHSCLEGHRHRVMSLAFSPDQQTLVSGGEDTTIRLWNAETGQLQRTLRGHQKQVWSVATSPDGRWIASGAEDQEIRLWNRETGNCEQVLQGHQNWVWKVAFSPCGQWLASASYDQTVRLWEVATGDCMQILKGHEGAVMAIAFTPDGRFLATGSIYDETIRLWNVTTGECCQIIPNQDTLCLAFSPLMAAHPSEPHPYPSSTKPLASKPQKRWPYTLASGSMEQAVVKLWEQLDVQSPQGKSAKQGDAPQPTQTLKGHDRWCFDLTFSSDGQTLISGSADETVRLWEVATGNCRQILRPARPYEGIRIAGVSGLAEAQLDTLRSLGAVDSSAPSIRT